MAYRRPRKSSAASSSIPYGRRHASTAQRGLVDHVEESSPGLETPDRLSVPLREPTSRNRFSRVSSVTRSLPEFSSPVLPPLRKKRVSLRLPTSHSASNLPTDARAEQQADESEAEDEVQRREDADSLNEIIMAVDMKERGTLGCAYYIAREEKLCLMEDIKMAGLDIVDLLKLHAQPTILLISSRAEEELEDHLMKDSRAVDRGDDDNSIFGSYVLDSRPSTEFQFGAAKNKLINLDITSEIGPEIMFTTPGDDLASGGVNGQIYNDSAVGRQGKLMRLAGWMDLDSRLTVGCAGAVLSYLLRRKSVEYLPGDEAAQMAFRVRTIEMFTLSDVMFINADTLASLQILQSESHPNSHMQGPNSTSSSAKESLSIFGLFYHLASTPQGKYKLRQIFLRPSLDIEIIQERQVAVGILIRPDNSPALEKMIKSLKKIKNIRTVVIHLQKGVIGASGRGPAMQRGVWANLQQFTFHTLKILEAVSELVDGQALMIVNKCLETLQPFVLKQIGSWITETVDFPRSAEQHRTAVMQGVDEDLDSMKRTYDGLGDLLSEIATKLANELPEWARKYIENCIFFPQLGFLTVVPLNPNTGKGEYEGEGTDDDVWEKRFCSGEMGYYKNRRMRETDEHFGDMYGMICDKEIEIIHALAVKTLEHEALLISASDICGELDSLVALARGAQEHKLVPATMTTENVIQIKEGRHLLQELSVASYVANDAFIRGGPGPKQSSESGLTVPRPELCTNTTEEPSLLMMTGPNYSGKSVYLKQVALIVYMAHLGSFVPAESATIGLTDKILTRIATRESISKAQSAFMIDLQQVALAMTLATHRSLILIDEFGKGTNAFDGAGLASGVFEHFLSLGPDRPKVLGATHFHEIFEGGRFDARPEIAFGHMEVRVDEQTEVLEDQVTYLYNFVPGRSTSSFGTCCAAMNGIDPAIVERAEQLILLSVRGDDLVAACSLLSEETTRALEEAEVVARQFLERDVPLPDDQEHTSRDDVRRMLDAVLFVG